ncbi:MAG: DUF3261 domain-containing protein [Haliea sp.]|nr:DUF3261 domain-containing protein [Haliea sp.]
MRLYQRPDDLPLTRHACPYGFAANKEIRATLSLQIAGRNEEYFLAIRTAKDIADIAVLAPQGIPVYSIHCSDSGTDVSSQARLTGGVQPELMLSYLEIIFMGGDDLRKLLKPQWTLEEYEDRRLLAKHSVDGQVVGEIRIAYPGGAPWFKEVKLEDTRHEMTLVLMSSGALLNYLNDVGVLCTLGNNKKDIVAALLTRGEVVPKQENLFSSHGVIR